MVWQPVRITLLFGAVAAVAVSSARADCCAPAPCGPTMRTICETVCVPETYQTTRTAYKYVTKVEAYTCYKSVCVPETRPSSRSAALRLSLRCPRAVVRHGRSRPGHEL